MKTLIFLSTFFIWALGAKTAESVLPHQSNASEIVLQSEGHQIFGTLELPVEKAACPVVLIIAGSGPTDRNGNNPQMINNSLKMLAEAFAEQGIASLRFDKRGIAQSQYEGFTNASILFDNYVTDAVNWLKLVQTDKRFSTFYIAGHSEGSLIGMLAAQKVNVNGFISLNGAGLPADEVIIKQVSNPQTPPAVVDLVKTISAKVKAGEKVEDVPPYLQGLFNVDIQPYLKNWFQYNPAVEIGKLKNKVLIIQGTTDIQVGTDQAELLSKGNPKATLKLIEGMNHIFKNADANPQLNIATYSNPDLPLNEELVQIIVGFVK